MWGRAGLAVATVAITGQAWAVETTADLHYGVDWYGIAWREWATFALAMLGAVLGLINTWSGFSARRLRVTVVPAHAMTTNGGTGFCIEIKNRSAFPIVVHEVGFTLKGTNRRVTVGRPYFIDNGAMPRRLDAREAFTAYFERPRNIGHTIEAAYARLASGEQVTGKSPALKQLNRELARG